MPKLLDYGHAMKVLRARRIVCVYPNSGAMGFESGVECTASDGSDQTIQRSARNARNRARNPAAVRGEPRQAVGEGVARRCAGRGVGDAGKSLGVRD
jgi:hypothetical protein